MLRNAYEAVNEDPRVFVAYGGTPAKCLKHMSTLLDESGVDFWVASRVDYIDHGPASHRFSIILYV